MYDIMIYDGDRQGKSDIKYIEKKIFLFVYRLSFEGRQNCIRLGRFSNSIMSPINLNFRKVGLLKILFLHIAD